MSAQEPPWHHIQLLASNSTAEATAEFNRVYGPEAAAKASQKWSDVKVLAGAPSPQNCAAFDHHYVVGESTRLLAPPQSAQPTARPTQRSASTTQRSAASTQRSSYDASASRVAPTDAGSLSVKALKSLLKAHRVDHSSCVEKADLVELARRHCSAALRSTQTSAGSSRSGVPRASQAGGSSEAPSQSPAKRPKPQPESEDWSFSLVRKSPSGSL